MGMFDKPQFLTGEDGYVQAGETFWLHAARLDGTANSSDGPREQVKLRVSRERDGETTDVWTSGKGIVNQVKRLDHADRSVMPFEVRLDQIPAKKAGNNPTNVLTPANEPPAASTASSGGPTDF